jgi:integrase
MKTKSIKSPGSLVKRGDSYYCFWRIPVTKDASGKVTKWKAICQVLRDENGASIKTEAEAQKAKANLMQIIVRQNEADSLRSIANEIDHKKSEIKAMQDAKNPTLALTQAWSAFKSSTNRRDCGKASLRMYEIKWQMFVDWMKKNHPNKLLLRDVDSVIASEYLESMNHGKYASGTYNFHLFVLRMIFRTLKREAKLTENVWMEAKLKTSVTHSRRELTIDELKKICGSAQGEMKLLFAIGLYTGLRLGDAVTLRWSETDLRRRMIRRIPNKLARRGGKPVVIPIHPDLCLMLADVPANGRGEYVLPEMASLYISPSPSRVSAIIQKHLIDCGIKTHGVRENGCRPVVEVGFHSLRHSFVSLSREAGAPLSVVESIVGHHSPAMTQHYTHTSELAARNAVALLPSMSDGPASSVKPSLRELIESMTPENVNELKFAALAMLATNDLN